MKLCIACSAGGHLTEMLQLEEAFREREHFFVTFKREDSRELARRERVFFVADPGRSPLKLAKNILQSISLFARERPDVIITTGAGVAVPLCYLSKLFGKKLIYIESFCRIKDPSLTGRLLYPAADLFLVQWKETLASYGKKARHYGGVF